jgi:hypothetical protein
MLDLTAKQIAILERCAAAEFNIVAFPLYESAVGIKKGNCAALLAPDGADHMKIFGEPCYLVEGNLAVRARRNGIDLFVWKKKELRVTSERLNEIAEFRSELDLVLHNGA